ncbi:hypothetical protein E1301_Tti019717 [Triplophysa tibetana]|uniref:Transmembrane protein 238 n=1 Tax=Triplophysa tibetana TaxID=1572043 RepID=A0A5A9NA74_9TELE|nr:hypothetical protein E1301_Tti019717 [Triplophysa tibetana]
MHVHSYLGKVESNGFVTQRHVRRLSPPEVPEMACADKCTKKVGRCFFFLCLAIVCDLAGLVVFLVGIFAPIEYWDLFVLSGPIIIFLSLVFWIFWYLGNLTVPYQELLPK